MIQKTLRQELDSKSKTHIYMLAQLFAITQRSNMNEKQLRNAVYKAMRYHSKSRRPSFGFGPCSDNIRCNPRALAEGATGEVYECLYKGAESVLKVFTRKNEDGKQDYLKEKEEFKELAIIDPGFEYFVKPLCFDDEKQTILTEKLE